MKILRVVCSSVLGLSLSAVAQNTAAAQPKSAPQGESKGVAKARQQTAKPWQQIPIPALPEFHPQEPKRIELSDGMVIFLQEDHELPLIDGRIRIRGGSRLEPAQKVGLMSVYGQAWRTGGTTTKTGDQLDDFLEARAARVETSGGIDSTSVSWSCLKPDFNEVFDVVLDVLRNPAFRDDKIALAKRQLDTAISRRNDEPDEIASREAAKIAYGAESPYARVPEYYTVGAVTRDDLMAWHQKYVQPNNIILGVVGDFDSAAMEAKLRQAFESWPRGPQAPREVEAPITPEKPGLYFVQKNDVNQSNVRMIALGIERNNPDYYAVAVMNEVLGGGFSGRLIQNLRTKAGLAYDVHGGVGAAYDHPGMFQLVMETKSGTTAAAIDGLYGQLTDLDKNPATPDELKRAKDSILNGFIFEFDDKGKVLAERMTYEFYGYPPDFLERFRAGIEKVTAEDVDRVAHKYVPQKNQLSVFVLGNATDFDRQLSTFGNVNKIDISIPESPPGAAPAAAKPAAANPQGKQLGAKVAEALGGEANLEKVKSLKVSMNSTRTTQTGDVELHVEQTVVYPDRAYVSLTAQGQTVTTVVTPTSAVISTPQGKQELPDEIRDANLRNLRRDLIYVAQHLNDPHFSFAAEGTQEIDGVSADVLSIDADGAPVKWYVDPASGHVLRSEFQTVGMQGPTERQIDYTDWRPAGTLTLPYQRTIKENGEVESQDKVNEVEVNPTLDPKLFETATAPAAAPK